MDGQMQVVYEPINAAVPQLNKQVGVLDNGHGTLTARQVPAEAFARVDASAQAASTHANTVAENARLLKAAAGRLDGIIGEMRGTVTAVQDFDERQRTQQQQQGADRLAQAQQGGGRPVARSQNGWPVNPPLQTRTIPGTNVRVTVARGPAGDVLTHVLTRFHYGVEPLDAATTGGYNPRAIGGGTVWSNHASGTAVDANWAAHPQGSAGTFSAAQVTEIRNILYDAQVVRWGGDFQNAAVDEMHFEIVGTPEQVQRAAERIRAIELTP